MTEKKNPAYGVDSFIDPYQLSEIVSKDKYFICVFGTGNISKQVYRVLKDFKIRIDAYTDNNKAKQGKKHYGIPIIAPEKLADAENCLVIIATMFYADVMCKLSDIGIENVYILAGTLAYPYKDAFRDRKRLLPRFGSKNQNTSERVLIKVWYGLGDNIVQLGILKYLKKIDPRGERFYFVVDAKFKYEFFSKIFPNVLHINRGRYTYKKRFSDTRRYPSIKKNYRYYILNWINRQHFTMAVGFHITPYWNYELFDAYNTNIPVFHLSFRFLERTNGLTNATALERMEPMARQLFGIPEGYNLDCKGLLAEYLTDVSPPDGLSHRYIAVSFGGASWNDCYPPEKIACIVKYFLNAGYGVVLLGAGRSDDKRNKKVVKIIGKHDGLKNFTNLNVYSSFKVIQDSEIFIGIDSGLCHAAYSLDKKAVVLRPAGTELADCFEHSDDKNIVYIKKEIACAGCVYCHFNSNPERYGECIKLVEPSEIIKAAESLLKK